jgi:hypothetical protein
VTRTDRYGPDVLATDWQAPARGRASEVAAALGMVVEEVTTDWCGEIVTIDRDLRTLVLEDRRGRRRAFPLGPGFLVDGRPVLLTAPARPGPAGPSDRTASGSVAVRRARARVARESRILVEGRHDAELVEKVWGDDLRLEGVVVEHLGGIDELVQHLTRLQPGPRRRIGVLVDHLVPGSKESRIAARIGASPWGADVLIAGHPYVDIWQAVRPSRVGLEAWPPVPRGEDWKVGMCRRLGWPAADPSDLARAWRHLLGRVDSWHDLEPELLGPVEALIDFVSAGEPQETQPPPPSSLSTEPRRFP